MASRVHELLVAVLGETPALADALRIVRGADAGRLSRTASEVSLQRPVERRPDGLLWRRRPGRKPSWVLLEVQTSRDEAKVRTVPLGLELALARHPGVPGDVVLVTVGMDVARFFDRHPFEVPGPLGTTRRLDVVRIDLGRTDPSTFLDPRRPYLAPLAVAAALGTPRLEEVTMKALRQAGREPAAQRDASRDAIFWLVGPSAAKKVGTMWKNYEFRSMFFKREVRKQTAKALARALPKAMAKGEVRYARAAVLRVLAARRIPATAEQRRRVGAERDLARLNRWLEAAARARRASDVFADA